MIRKHRLYRCPWRTLVRRKPFALYGLMATIAKVNNMIGCEA